MREIFELLIVLVFVVGFLWFAIYLTFDKFVKNRIFRKNSPIQWKLVETEDSRVARANNNQIGYYGNLYYRIVKEHFPKFIRKWADYYIFDWERVSNTRDKNGLFFFIDEKDFNETVSNCLVLEDVDTVRNGYQTTWTYPPKAYYRIGGDYAECN